MLAFITLEASHHTIRNYPFTKGCQFIKSCQLLYYEQIRMYDRAM